MTCPRLEDVEVLNSQQSVKYGNKFRWSVASAGTGEDDGSQAKRMHSLIMDASRRTRETTEAGTLAQQALWGRGARERTAELVRDYFAGRCCG